VRALDEHLNTATWKAVYWYAAAHEDTVCDVSQIARAATLNSEDHGATIWISPGKHASYLNETLCHGGCGADRCENMVPLRTTALINLGEPSYPMNGSIFISSSEWPLTAKMSNSNFPGAPIARLNQLPDTDIAWFNPGSHPAQGVIATSLSTERRLPAADKTPRQPSRWLATRREMPSRRPAAQPARPSLPRAIRRATPCGRVTGIFDTLLAPRLAMWEMPCA